MADKNRDFKEKVCRLLAELLADQKGGTLVSFNLVDEQEVKSEKEVSCG